MPRISRVSFLLAHHGRTDRGGIADPKLVSQFGEDPLEPLRVPGRLHAHSHRLLQAGVKLRSFTVPVFEAALDEFAGLGVCHCDLLKTGMKVTTYNQHARLLPSESWSVRETLIKLSAFHSRSS